jgi:hypothetical protein
LTRRMGWPGRATEETGHHSIGMAERYVARPFTFEAAFSRQMASYCLTLLTGRRRAVRLNGGA